jgi:hypothetical protein
MSLALNWVPDLKGILMKKDEPKTPELDKMLAVKKESQAIGEFISWLKEEKNYYIAERVAATNFQEESDLMPVQISTEKLLAEFFEIDLDKAEKERWRNNRVLPKSSASEWSVDATPHDPGLMPG